MTREMPLEMEWGLKRGNGLETAGKCQGIESVTFFGQLIDRTAAVGIGVPMEMWRICALMPSHDS